MISSTARDLPEHRKQVMDACLRESMLPVMMEHLPASDSDAIAESLRMVDGANIYLGVLAHRYGYVPNGHDISITEMECNRAKERGIPRLIFVMDKDHPIRIEDVEMGEAAAKLQKLKERLQKEKVVSFFKSSEELRSQVIHSLSQKRQPDATIFHYVSNIPKPPETYIAHPYTLLQSRELIGRQTELNLLTDWVAKPASDIYQSRIFNFVAIGGMGKSALTWKWFNDIAPQEMKPLAGRMWWSFYESDARFENFIIRALAYVSGRSKEDIEAHTKPGEREDQLLAILDREPFLFVLDGLERILIAYARMDANRLADDDLDQQTANWVANAYGLPESAAQSFIGQHLLRKTADPRAGNFLRKLARVQASRVLVSTRLYPAELQTTTGSPTYGCFACFLQGLSDDDALNLWRSFGVTGSRDELLRMFHTFGNHPLLIQALTSEIAKYRRAPGDFDKWQKDNPDFNPFTLPIVQARSHVLQFALQGIEESSKKVLHTVAAFRMPASFDTLVALLVGKKKGKQKAKLLQSENELDAILTGLEDRGLLGWDRRANRYDLHPIVRGVIWNGMDGNAKTGVYENLQTHFEALPKIEDWQKVDSLEDLTSAIELYSTLIGQERYDDAFNVFHDRLSNATLYRLSVSRQRVELLEMLFPDGLDQLPRLNTQRSQAFTLTVLALGYQHSGQPRRATSQFRRAVKIDSENKDSRNLTVDLSNLSGALRISGSLCESEFSARRAVVISREQKDDLRESVCLDYLGIALAALGVAKDSEQALQRSLRMFVAQNHVQFQGSVNSSLAERALWFCDFAAAQSLADRAWEMAHTKRLERDFIRASRVQGEAALRLNDFAIADERLHHSLTRARAVNIVQEELPALIALAELRRQQGDAKAARDYLDDIWEAAERGPYPLIHADAFNVLAQIERDAGNTNAAIEAATKAYQKAWCDGPPYAYHWGLEKAREHLRALNAPEPDMPPFDPSKYEPMPEVEIDPPDESDDEQNVDYETP